jgi:multicomponent Na+:H+ antiporter subunit G
MELVTTALTWIFVLAGSAFIVVGGVGVMRLPDVFARMHGAALTDTMGAGLILVGLMFESGFSAPTVRLVMILFFLWYTGPLASYALAKAALAAGLRPLTKADRR